MKVSIKSFDVTMELKNKGIELDVADTAGVHLGDLVVTKTQLIWCGGKTHRENGYSASWTEFIQWMQSKR